MELSTQEQKAITRIRKSKQAETNAAYRDGEEAGIDFALHEATFFQLERLRDVLHYSEEFDLEWGRFAQLAAFIGAPPNLTKCSPRDWAGVFEEKMRAGRPARVNIDEEKWLSGFIDGATRAYARLYPEI